MSKYFKVGTAGALIASLLLAACGKTVPSATSLNRDALMGVVFQGWDAKHSKVSLTVPPADANGGAAAGGDAKPDAQATPTAARFDIEPSQVIKLSDTRAVMITTSMPVDEQDHLITTQTTKGLISAYWFKRDGDRWFADGRQDMVAWTGYAGNPGTTRVIKLTANKYGFGVENGSCWQGTCGSWLSLYEVDDSSVQSLTTEAIHVAADNAGTNGCDAVLKQPVGKAVLNQQEDSGQPCFRFTGKWSVSQGTATPGDLAIDFTADSEERQDVQISSSSSSSGDGADGNDDTQNQQAANGYTSSHTKTHTKATYHYRNGQYVLTKGENPVPDV